MAALEPVSKTTRDGEVGLPLLFCDGMSLVGPSPNLLHHHRCVVGGHHAARMKAMRIFGLSTSGAKNRAS